MASPFDGPEIDVDRLLADLMDDYLSDEEKPSVRFLAVINNGKAYRVKVDGNLIWFPSGRIKRRPKQ